MYSCNYFYSRIQLNAHSWNSCARVRLRFLSLARYLKTLPLSTNFVVGKLTTKEHQIKQRQIQIEINKPCSLLHWLLGLSTSLDILWNWEQSNGKQVYSANPWRFALNKLQNACQGIESSTNFNYLHSHSTCYHSDCFMGNSHNLHTSQLRRSPASL